jgi:hypothetical protein
VDNAPPEPDRDGHSPIGALASRLVDGSDITWSDLDAPTRLRGQAAARTVTA